ncbi:MAG: InlB B-repeat-containing protein, partial [Clostridiales bacterium]|nr:InlB B-repeat-containing protein [Clostridiales bacterium]
MTVTRTGNKTTYGSGFVVAEDNITIQAANPNDKPVIYGFTNEYNAGVDEFSINGQDTVYVSGANVTLKDLVIMPLGGYPGGDGKSFPTKVAEAASGATAFTMTGCETTPNTMTKSGLNGHNMTTSSGNIYVSVNDASISGNSFGAGTTISAADNCSVNVSGNYWGEGVTAADIADMIDGNVIVNTYYTDADMTTTETIGGTPVATADQLEKAIANAKDGDTIVLANDITITSALDVTKDITIDGNNHTLTADECVGLYIKDDLNYLTVKNLTLKGVLDDGKTAGEGATGSFMGIGTYNGCFGVGKLTLTDVTIDGFSYGLYFGKNPAGGTGPFNEKDVTVDADNLTIQNCYIKGAYFEKLTESSFTDCQFLNNGADPEKVQNTFQTWMSGVDINLKNGSYQNIVFDGCTFKGNGANQGTALLLKARDDGNYGNNTKLDGVTVTDCIFTDNNSAVTPIIIGEEGKDNKSPVNVSIQDGVAYTNNLETDAVYIVTFKYDGNTTINTVLAKGDITLPAAPSRAGYSFRGWYGNGHLYAAGDVVTITEDTTFVAQWSDNTPYYTITVKDAENGTVTCYAKSAAKGADVTLTVKADVGYQLDKLTVTDASGNVIDVEKVNNTTYTFVMPGSKVTVEAVFAPTTV